MHMVDNSQRKRRKPQRSQSEDETDGGNSMLQIMLEYNDISGRDPFVALQRYKAGGPMGVAIHE